MYGRNYMGTARVTFVIDENGIISEVIGKVDTKNHAAQILKTGSTENLKVVAKEITSTAAPAKKATAKKAAPTKKSAPKKVASLKKIKKAVKKTASKKSSKKK
jgi:thioredoxin-dependent peroxiredoxin